MLSPSMLPSLPMMHSLNLARLVGFEPTSTRGQGCNAVIRQARYGAGMAMKPCITRRKTGASSGSPTQLCAAWKAGDTTRVLRCLEETQGIEPSPALHGWRRFSRPFPDLRGMLPKKSGAQARTRTEKSTVSKTVRCTNFH
ncbi:MAG: hypothetical protein [Caudoviricetes sp.]|nr:MAG: hypothetical protein [Caudoviricetes sp.]